MIALSTLAALFFAQSSMVSIPGPDPQIYEIREVAYDALASGDSKAAIATLEARLPANPGDPALLINLGTAYLMSGKPERAAAAYRAAADSSERYSLELADGTWIDSRRVALRALRAVESRSLALR